MVKGKAPTYEEFLARHSAGLRSLGFDEQFACFVSHLLEMKADESISYEKEDDIVINKRDGKKVFIQVKNSAEIPPRKMTTADGDFWKTMKLWVDGFNHYKASDKSTYFDNRSFVIATNMPVDNDFYNKLIAFQTQLTDIKGLRKWLDEYKSENQDIKDAVSSIRAMSDNDLRMFALSVRIEQHDDFQGEMYNSSLVCFKNNPATDEIINELLGALIKDKKQSIKDSGGSFTLTKVQFINKYFDILNKASIDPELNVTEYDPYHWCHPDEIEETNMLRQLWDIGELEKDQPSDKTYRYMYQKRYYLTNIERFKGMELVDERKQKAIELAAINKWQPIWDKHESKARGALSEKQDDEAIECFHETMIQPFMRFDENFSGGCYLNLSDENPPRLGWHINWKNKYGA